MNKIKPLKIVAGLSALILIFGILFVTNAFVGNPISRALANKSIKSYVEQNYSFLDLEVEKPVYNFKFSSYMARAKSKTSIDTKFSIYYKNGKVQRDDYDSYVLGMFNTIQRLSDEYSALAKSLISKELGFEKNTTMVMYDKGEYEKGNKKLKLDMKFDRNLPMDAEVILRVDLKDNSIESIEKVLRDAHKVFLDNGCKFIKYGLYTEENDGMLVMVNDVTPAHIESGEFESLLKKAKTGEDADGIRVFIKGEEKK